MLEVVLSGVCTTLSLETLKGCYQLFFDLKNTNIVSLCSKNVIFLSIRG